MIRRFLRNFVFAIKRTVISALNKGVSLGKNVNIAWSASIKCTDSGRLIIEDDVFIGRFSTVTVKRGVLHIGRNSHFSHGATIVCIDAVEIGAEALVGEYVTIRDQNHGVKIGSPFHSQPVESSRVSIGQNVWIGAHSCILAGSDIGPDAVVGANSVVNGVVHASTLSAGSPAREIKQLEKHGIERPAG